MLNPDTLGALYLTVFRLAVIAAATLSIFCGYKLLEAGGLGHTPGKSQTDVGARLGGMQFTLKSAAPGTCFAFFGALVIAVMMFSAPPEFSRSRGSGTVPGGEATATEDVRMRGQAKGLAELVEEARLAERAGDKKRAIKGYESALRLVAEPLNNLAFLYHEEGHDNEAVPLAQLATQFAPTEIEFVDTLNKVRTGGKK